MLVRKQGQGLEKVGEQPAALAEVFAKPVRRDYVALLDCWHSWIAS